MYKIAVIGDYESIYGFSALGLETYPTTLPETAKKTLKKLVDDNYGIVYITEALAQEMTKEIEELKKQVLPAVIVIPGTYGNNGMGVDGVKKSVEQAVGSDILFGED